MCEIVTKQPLDNIAKLKKTKNAVFNFESLLTQLFFYETNIFPRMTSWESDECSMKLVTECYRARLENVRYNDIDSIMIKFQSETKKR